MQKTVSRRRVSGELFAPASKSYAQRAVAVATLAEGISTLTNIDLCNDTKAALEVAKTLGAEVLLEDRTCTIKGVGVDGANHDAILDIGESGLSSRLFAPVAALSKYQRTITGHGSILSRPMSMVIIPLLELGASVSSSIEACLPMNIVGPIKGGEITINGSTSSQFLTGLLIALPMVDGDSVINVTNLKSRPYIDMTIELLEQFGITTINENYETFRVRGNSRPRATTYNIEGDWSGASCILTAGAIAGEVKVKNLNYKSAQADRAITTALDYAGASLSYQYDGLVVGANKLKGFSFDATECPDLFPALAALASACEGESVIMGTSRLRHKESDRASTIKEVYEAMGISVDLEYDNVMIIKGGVPRGDVTVSSFGDHRIAMTVATAALRAESPVVITGSEAVSKSYPGFWDDLDNIISQG